MPMQALSFPDKFFSHIIINCAIFRLSDADAIRACKEMHRTLQPGGSGIVTCWAEVPHRAALQAAHEATREKDAPALVGGSARWIDGELLRRYLAEGGFEDLRMEMATAVNEVGNLESWGRGMWSVLGRTEEGWLEGDERAWEDAVRTFMDTIKVQEGVETLPGGSTRIRFEAWVAVVRK